MQPGKRTTRTPKPSFYDQLAEEEAGYNGLEIKEAKARSFFHKLTLGVTLCAIGAVTQISKATDNKLCLVLVASPALFLVVVSGFIEIHACIRQKRTKGPP